MEEDLIEVDYRKPAKREINVILSQIIAKKAVNKITLKQDITHNDINPMIDLVVENLVKGKSLEQALEALEQIASSVDH